MKTWHLETAVVATVLTAVALVSGGGALELLGAGAVLLSFGHASIGDRLAEREAARPVASVECHRSLVRYWIGKEILWAAYFVAHGSWAAIAGVALFLLHPVWRRWYRRRRPLGRGG